MAAKKNETPNTWTFYDGFAKAVEMLPNATAKASFVYDLYKYGSWGIEPTFGWATDPAVKMAVEMAWQIATPSIDKNIKDRKNGKKGGRPKKNQADMPTLSFEQPMIEQAALAADAMGEPIPDAVVDMLASNIYEEVEVW